MYSLGEKVLNGRSWPVIVSGAKGKVNVMQKVDTGAPESRRQNQRKWSVWNIIVKRYLGFRVWGNEVETKKARVS